MVAVDEGNGFLLERLAYFKVSADGLMEVKTMLTLSKRILGKENSELFY